MQNRKLGLIFASVSCAAIVGASYHAIPSRLIKTNAEYWRQAGLDPVQGEGTQRRIRQFVADVRHNRPVPTGEFAWIKETIKNGGPLGTLALSNSICLIGTKYQGKISDLAVECSKSSNEQMIFESLEVLRVYKYPLWRELALSHKNDSRPVVQIEVEEAEKGS